MKYILSKPFRNTISNFKNKLLGKTAPEEDNEHYKKYFSLQRDNRTWKGVPTKDDFNWSLYNIYYRGEVETSAKSYTQTLREGDYSFQDGKLLKINDSILPLHPNHQLLYETILQLAPQSAFEIGFGSGMHLKNLKTLSPGIDMSGVERSEDQIAYSRETYPDLEARTWHHDATQPFQDRFPTVDLAYTQTVIMHIKTGNTHMNALANLFAVAKDQVILVEHWHSHPLMRDVQRLFKKNLVPWKELYLYYRVSDHDPAIRLMICSSRPLDYPVLTDYGQLKDSEKGVSFWSRLKGWVTSY